MRIVTLIASAAALAAAGLAVATVIAPAYAKPPLAAFGDQPTVRAMEISPDGKTLAYIQLIGEKEMFVLMDLATGKRTNLIDASNIKARAITFIGTDYALLHGSKTIRPGDSGELAEMGGAFAVNLKTAKANQLLPAGSNGILQGGVGDILAVTPDGRNVYLDAFSAANGNSSYVSFDLVKVNLDTGSQVGPGVRGTGTTHGWLSDADGKPVARVDVGSVSSERKIFGYIDGKAHEIYSSSDVLSELAIVGVKESGGSILVVDRDDNADFASLKEMSLADGKTTPLLGRNNADIEGVITDRQSRVVKGVVYGGFRPVYEFFDKAINADVATVQKSFPQDAVHLASWSDDWNRMLFLVEGGQSPSQYVLVDRAKGQMGAIAATRPGITEQDIGQVVPIRYNARDKLAIPALVTWPAGVAENDRKNLPTIVMPHGGPEAYDRIGFDWLAQFFANEGYLVLQPEFRGSDGFGARFRDAGHLQWGKAMQTDISDGLATLVSNGWADPSRVCIVGWSYGGYAALAGATLTPELYKCIVAIAGVSDLPLMLGWERRSGEKNQAFIFWRSRIGDPAKDMDAIKAVSPAQQAANVHAPVLLIHGSSDTTVPIEQSESMERALKSLGKQVQLVRITGDDHSLTTSKNRREALTAIGDFLAKNLGPGAPRSAPAPAGAATAAKPN
jgi:dipeptidyl aminopeptidase/acylaminoacyl peptidase